MDGAQNWNELFPRTWCWAGGCSWRSPCLWETFCMSWGKSTLLLLHCAQALPWDGSRTDGLGSIGSMTQTLSWEGSLCISTTSTLCWHCTAEPKIKISQLQVIAGKNHRFLRLPQITTKVHVPEQLVLPQAMWLFHLAVGFRGATLSPAAAGLNCFLPLIKEIKVTKHRFSWNPCVKLWLYCCAKPC